MVSIAGGSILDDIGTVFSICWDNFWYGFHREARFFDDLETLFDHSSPRPGQKEQTGALTTHFANDVPSTMIFAFSDMTVVSAYGLTPRGIFGVKKESIVEG